MSDERPSRSSDPQQPSRQRTLREAVPLCTPSVRPVYAVDENEAATLVGSCVLVAIHGRRFVASAAHVQDSHDGPKVASYPHVGALNGRIIPVGDIGYRTPRADFHPTDVWLVPVADVEAEKLGTASFIEIGRASANATFELYLAAGYPFKSQRYPGGRNPETGAMAPTGKSHGSVEVWPRKHSTAPEAIDLSVHGYDPAKNVAVHFDRTRMRRDGQRVTFPFPEGISGGGLFGFSDQRDASTWCLAAILTHWLPKPTYAMVGTRTSTLVDFAKLIPL